MGDGATSAVPRPARCSSAATKQFRGLWQLLPLPCANSTTPCAASVAFAGDQRFDQLPVPMWLRSWRPPPAIPAVNSWRSTPSPPGSPPRPATFVRTSSPAQRSPMICIWSACLIGLRRPRNPNPSRADGHADSRTTREIYTHTISRMVDTATAAVTDALDEVLDAASGWVPKWVPKRLQRADRGFRAERGSAVTCGVGGAPGGIRTPDLLIRSQMLSSAELPAPVVGPDLRLCLASNFAEA
jgi:hypothetical protein